jgi:uncharacterized membrane protein
MVGGTLKKSLAAGLALLLIAGAACAEGPFPAQFSVTGVAADDVLNMRVAPSAGADLLSSFRPDRMNLEVIELSADGQWGLVGDGEINGYGSMRFLARQDQIEGQMPRPMRCFGTEPFWTLGFYPGGDEYVTPDGRADLVVQTERIAENGFALTLTDDGDSTWLALIEVGACSDGMSDRRYGYRTLISRPDGAGGSILRGCCSVDGG